MYITDLFEAKNVPVVVTYPGRFQPFHQGHAGVFAELQKLFGTNNVYILTSNDQSGPKSPFDFSDKRQLMTAAGVPGDHIVQTTAMYALPDGFDPHNTIFVTAVGAPDADRLNPDSVLKRDKKDKAGNIIKPAGSPGYYKTWGGAEQAVTADQHGYVVVIPEIHKEVKIKGRAYDVSHGTECRNLWNIIRGDAKARSEFLTQLYGRPDAKLGQIFDKIPAAVAEGEVKQFPKKHQGNLDDVHDCVKCGGDLQGGTYMGHRIKVCIPCKQVYLPPNSGIDQKGNKISEQGMAGGLTETRNSLLAWVKQQFPTWPDYVLTDFLYAQAKGIRDQAELDDFLKRNKQDFGNCKWTLTKLPITFDIFTPKTQRMLASREGGSSNPFQVPRDAERHAQQSQMIQQKGVSAEPIIVAKLANGYDLIEGWHRTIQHLKAFPQGYTGPAWVCTGATYKSESVEQGVAEDAAGVGVVATNKKMARDPRYSTSMTVDVHPDTPKKQLKAFKLAEMKPSDFEIRNFEKLDTILTELCKQVIAHQKQDPDYWGMVAACVVDPDDNVVPGINYLDDSGKRVHAERAAIDSYREHYGEIPEGSIIVTTLSPCCHPLEERYGESCTELINDTDIHKVYCGYKDPTQEQTMNRTFHIMQTRNASIVELCKSFADTFLGQVSEDADTKHSIGEDDMMAMVREFMPVAMRDLKIKNLPRIVLQPHVEEHDGQATFGRFADAEERIYLGIADRHPVDILRTLAHELVHFKQYEDNKMYPGAGKTGSPIENEAHVVAGIIMRHFNKKYPMAIKSKPLEL